MIIKFLSIVTDLYKYFKFIVFIIFQKLSVQYQKYTDRLRYSHILVFFADLIISKLPLYSTYYVDTLFIRGGSYLKQNKIAKYIENHLKYIRTSHEIKYALRHALFIPDLDLAMKIITLNKNNPNLNEAFAARSLALFKGNFLQHLEAYRYTPKKKRIKKYFPSKYVNIEEIEKVLRSNSSIALLTTLGPGDELLFSSVYTGLVEDELVNINNINVVCDYRFFDIFNRSFPNINFIPTRRSRFLKSINDYNLFSNLPAYELHRLICNSSYRKIKNCDKFLLSQDLLVTYNDLYGIKKNNHRLVPNQKKVESFKKRLNPDKVYIGISWRSGLLSSFRNNYYLSIEELEPIFSIKNITFINLQYDDSSLEQSWMEKKYPGKLISFEDIDMYNDFDSVLSLMECLDAVVAPPTIVNELSVNLRKKTILLSIPAESQSRIICDNRDCYYHNLIHITGDQPGDKDSLVQNLENYLKNNF